MSTSATFRERLDGLRLAPDGRTRPDAPFARGPAAARVLARVIDGAAWIGSRLSVGLAHGLATFGGHAEWALRRAKRQALAVNLSHAIGAPSDALEVRRAVRREIVNEAHRSADLLWALGRPDDLLASIALEGVEHAREAIKTGKGLVIAGLHLGGWEIATAVPRAVLSVPTTAIVADDWLAWAIEHMRATAGLRILYRTAPGIGAVRRLQAGEALLVLADDGWGPEPRTYPVRFLDSYADFPAGTVALARLCQAPIVTFAVLPLGWRRWQVAVTAPLAPPPRHGGPEGEQAVLQHLADQWTALIRAHPDHWAASYRIRWHDSSAGTPT